MEQRQTPASQSFCGEAAPAGVQGPQELDPSLFALVGGGSPRTGWLQLLLPGTLDDSPRTGWW